MQFEITTPKIDTEKTKEEKFPIAELFQNNPELARIYQEHSATININLNEGGQIEVEGHTYNNIPKIRATAELAAAIRKSLPEVPEGYVRLWRGNRIGEVGSNSSYANSLEGIALPFLMSYKGVLSYVDIPKEDEKKYLVDRGAHDAEFILPEELVKKANVVGFTPEEGEKIKGEARIVSEAKNNKFDEGWTAV